MPRFTGLGPMSGSPLTDGTNYKELLSAAAFALTQHWHEYAYSHGRKELT